MTIKATAALETITNSRSQKMKTCNRAHQLSYEIGLRPHRTSEPLSRGTAYHLAREAYDNANGNHEHRKAEGRKTIALYYSDPPSWCTSDDDIHAWLCQAQLVSVMFELHADYWINDSLEVIATEQTFNLPLINPDTGQPSRNFRIAGKIDRIVRLPAHDGRLAVQEYKTTISDIGVEADYWKRLRIDSQISNYVLAARALGHAVETVLYDVLRWPALRPSKATPEENRKYTKDGNLYANQRADNESPEDYGRRVYTAVIENPERYFQRQEIVRLEPDLREHQYDVWAQQKHIRECQRTGIWPRNTNSCLGHYGRCEFFDICTGGQYESVLAGVIPEGFRIASTMHEELADDQ